MSADEIQPLRDQIASRDDADEIRQKVLAEKQAERDALREVLQAARWLLDHQPGLSLADPDSDGYDLLRKVTRAEKLVGER